MKWYFKIAGGHTHVRVFMNGGKCGDLCFRNEEFEQVRMNFPFKLEFIDETPKEEPSKECGCPSVACPVHGLPDGSASGGW